MPRETLFERMSRIARQRPEERQMVKRLDEAAMCRMPAKEQIRFRSFLDELSGERPRSGKPSEPPNG